MSDQDDTEIEDVDTDPVDDTDETEGADKLGDPGKKALDAMKAKWQKERDARKALEDQLAKKPAPKDDSKTDAPDPEVIREQARKEARTEVLKERALDKVEARAAKLFADPEDAVALLARKADDFIDGDSVDTDAIDEALADLLKKKPHLAAQSGKRFNGSADGGARKGSGKPSQLTEQDLKRMSPQEIVAAREKGQLADLMGAT